MSSTSTSSAAAGSTAKSSAADQVDRLAVWEDRESAFLRYLPYLPLAAATLLAAFAPAPYAPALPGTLALAAGAAVWITAFLLLRPPLAGNRRVLLGYYLGLLAFCAALVLHSPWYGFFAWVGFLHAFLALPGRWALAGVAATAVLLGTAQSGGLPRSPGHWLLWGVLVTVNVVAASVVSWFGWIAARQAGNRRQLIDELAAANRRLAETMRENEGLHAQLLTQAREAGVLDERQRLARDIHDTLAQGLIGIVTQLEAAQQARDRHGDWQRHIRHAMTLARENLAEARRTVRAVRPEPLAAARLPEALAEVAERWSTINGVPVQAATAGRPRHLHPEIEVTLLRAGQEALANVAKHAAAHRVGLTLTYMDDLVTLDIRDDGVGFEPALVRAGPSQAPASDMSGGFGLTAMRQRVDAIGGRLAVESEPGLGTAISITVPAAAAGAA